MKIVFMGTPDFAVAPLHAMVEAGYEVAAVITQPDKPKGRGKTLMPTPVKEEALKHGLTVYQPIKVRDPEFLSLLKELDPDIIVVAAFGQIIPSAILDLPRFGCINIHASLLPKYRGAAPIQQAVIDGEKESGVTIMKMSTGLDTGDMIAKAVVPLSTDETGGSLFDKLASAGAELLVKTLPSIFDGTAVYEKQPEESPTPYAAMITKQMGLMDFTNSAEKLERLVRGLNPWPSAYTYLNGKTLKVWKSRVGAGEADAEPGSAELDSAEPGTVTAIDKEGIHVACGQGVLVLTEVQLEGKKRMDADAFLRGYSLQPGGKLGNPASV
ncbi:methionyl-tRNA formyltransferase [Blautia schinkii]|nr:methionyl-tRNA formyltransferase [Blautia schinkii]